jgi:hypothetical protein
VCVDRQFNAFHHAILKVLHQLSFEWLIGSFILQILLTVGFFGFGGIRI